MKANKTVIAVVMDRSGSMASMKDAPIEGFNVFVRDQSEIPSECLMSYIQFDDRYEVVHNLLDIGKVPPLTSATYSPRGSTALLDAIGRTIDELGRTLAAMPEDERPEKTVLAIFTDGYENASREYRAQQVADMIAHQREKYNWQILFLAANLDAIATAAQMNIRRDTVMNFAASDVGTRAIYGAVGQSVRDYRENKTKGVVIEASVKDEEQGLLSKAPIKPDKTDGTN